MFVCFICCVCHTAWSGVGGGVNHAAGAHWSHSALGHRP